jgi:hypothetical protein
MEYYIDRVRSHYKKQEQKMKTEHVFNGWDSIDKEIQNMRLDSNLSEKFEITAWGFNDTIPIYYHFTDTEELPYIPIGCAVVVLHTTRIDIEKECTYPFWIVKAMGAECKTLPCCACPWTVRNDRK